MFKGRIGLKALETEAILFLYKLSCCITVEGVLVIK